MSTVKKWFALFLMIAMVLSLATTAFAYEPAENAAEMSAELRYIFWDEGQRPGIEKQIEKFNEYYPNIKVNLEFLAWDQYWEKIQTEINGGTCADIFMNQTWWFKTLQAAGAAENLSALAEADGYSWEGHMQPVMDIYSEEGQLYAIPRDWDTICVVYNKDLFDQYNIPYPDASLTWNPTDGGSFVELAQKMTIDVNGNNALSPDFDPEKIDVYGFAVENSNNEFYWNLMLMNGGNIEDYTTEKNVETMQFAQDLFFKYKVTPPFASVRASGADTMFASGKIAMYWEGNWQLSALKANCDFNIGICELPSGPDGFKTLVNGIGESIYSGSQHKEEAWELLKFLASDEGQEILAKNGTVLVSRSDYWDDFFAYWAENGIDAQAYMRTFENAETSIAPLVPNWTEKNDAITKNYELLFLGQIDSQQAADNIGAVYASLGE